jgi:hypothetical protein
MLSAKSKYFFHLILKKQSFAAGKQISPLSIHVAICFVFPE